MKSSSRVFVAIGAVVVAANLMLVWSALDSVSSSANATSQTLDQQIDGVMESWKSNPEAMALESGFSKPHAKLLGIVWNRDRSEEEKARLKIMLTHNKKNNYGTDPFVDRLTYNDTEFESTWTFDPEGNFAKAEVQCKKELLEGDFEGGLQKATFFGEWCASQEAVHEAITKGCSSSKFDEFYFTIRCDRPLHATIEVFASKPRP